MNVFLGLGLIIYPWIISFISVELSTSKRKLLLYSPSRANAEAEYFRAANYISLAGVPIEIVSSTEHVGIIRSSDGNLPHILKRMSSHNKALHSIMSAGLARNHRGNPAAALKVEQLYGVPVLLSGTAALVLKTSEEELIDKHLKSKLQNLQKLHEKTPRVVVHFL